MNKNELNQVVNTYCFKLPDHNHRTTCLGYTGNLTHVYTANPEEESPAGKQNYVDTN